MIPQLVPRASCPVLEAATAPPLLERCRLAARARGDLQPGADTPVTWARALILFHNKRHPSELGLPEVTHFFEHIVMTAPEPGGTNVQPTSCA